MKSPPRIRSWVPAAYLAGSAAIVFFMNYLSVSNVIALGLAFALGFAFTFKHPRRLAREFDLLASMHVGGGIPMVPLGFERLLDDDLVDGHLTVVHGNDIAADTVRRIVDRGGTLCSLGMSGVSKLVDISQPRLLKRGTHVVKI